MKFNMQDMIFMKDIGKTYLKMVSNILSDCYNNNSNNLCSKGLYKENFDIR